MIEQILEQARALGFNRAGVTPAKISRYFGAYQHWIENGRHGSMTYMARLDRIERRRNLNAILPGVRSIISVSVDYPALPIEEKLLADCRRGRISNYAWRIDYHDTLQDMLKHLAEFIQTIAPGEKTLGYVDTGAILERSHAEEAGLGFTGKNTMLIHPRHGSYFFIGEVLTTLELPFQPTPRPMPGCGSCTRCIDACPTSAFPEPMVLDARRCISYLTIEHKGIIDRTLRPLMKNWVFGCDICQQVCPWQRFASIGDAELKRLTDTYAPELSTLLLLTDEVFEKMYSGTPVARVGRDRMVRNACIAVGNSNQHELLEHLTPLLRDHSALVRAHAAWAVGRLGGLERLHVSLLHEDDPEVRSEIEYALATEES